jgi:hypothetical protein
MHSYIARRTFAFPIDAIGIEIAFIQGHRTPRNRQGRIDLRYLVVLDIYFLDRVVRAQPTELNAETMEEYNIVNFRHRIDEYWDHHTVRPDTARDVLAVKRPDNYRPLWGRVPGAEAQALYMMDMLGCLAYWRPGYIINDILRVLTSVDAVHPALVEPQVAIAEEDPIFSEIFDFGSSAQGTS